MLVDDEQPVGELSPYSADKPFRVAVSPRTSRWDLHNVDASVSENGIERGRELASPVTNQETKLVGPVIQLHEEVASLLCGPRTVRVGGGAEDVWTSRVPTSITKNTYTRFNVTAQSTWKKSHASMLAA